MRSPLRRRIPARTAAPGTASLVIALAAALVVSAITPPAAAAAADDPAASAASDPASPRPTALTMHGVGLGATLNSRVCDFNGDGSGDIGASLRDGFSTTAWSDSEAEQNAAGVTSTYQPRGNQWSNALSDASKTRRCIGDINHDGVDDILETGAAGTRAVSVNLYGSPANAAGKLGDRRFINYAFPATAEFSSPAFGALGAGAAGDVDGDGLGDFAFSQQLADASGRVWVLAGRAGAVGSAVQSHTVSGATTDPSLVAAIIDGAAPGDRLGGLTGIGDVDGDGRDDLLVASAVTGTVWLIHGAARGDETRRIDLGDLDPTDGRIFARAAPGSGFGSSVAVLDDADGDGVQDYLFGLAGERGGPGGAVVVFGSASGAVVDVDLAASTVRDSGAGAASRGYVIEAEGDRDGFGFAVAGLGDVNGDGRSDLLIGAPGFDPASADGSTLTDAGAAYVLYGRSGGGVFRTSALAEADGYRLDGPGGDARYSGKPGNFGAAVARIGDIDRNGVEDFVVGAPTFAHLSAAQTGAVFVALRGEIGSTLALAASRRSGDDRLPIEAAGVYGTDERFELSANLRLSTLRGLAGDVAFTLDGAPIAGGACDAVAASGPQARRTHQSFADCEPADGIVIREFGEHRFGAAFAGDAAVSASSDEFPIYITDASTTTVRAERSDGALRLDAAVSARSSERTVDSGTVTFTAAGGSVPACAEVPVRDGQASCVWEDAPAGLQEVTADYSGASVRTDGEGGEPAVEVEVLSASSGAASSVSRPRLTAPRLSRSSYVQASTNRTRISVGVTGVSSGTVRFRAGGQWLGGAPVRAGAASLTVPASLRAGRYTITAVLQPDAEHGTVSRAATSRLTVSRAAPRSVSISAKRFARGARPVVRVTVARLTNGAFPVGRVLVTVGGRSRSATLTAGDRGAVRVTAPRGFSRTVSASARFVPRDTGNVAGAASKTIRIRVR